MKVTEQRVIFDSCHFYLLERCYNSLLGPTDYTHRKAGGI